MVKEVNEDKMIAQKMARVREVVTNVSKNDIIMALHSNDLDVDRTIQALMEGGALDEWVRPAGTAGKKGKKNNNNNAKKVAEPAPTASAPVPAAIAPKPVAAPIVPSVPLTSQTKKPTAPAANGVNGNDKKTHDTSSVDGALVDSERLATHFGTECRQARDTIQHMFKSLRDVLAERERAVLAELSRQEAAATKQFAANKSSIEAAKTSAAAGADVSAQLCSIAKQEAELAACDLFTYDMTKLVQQINAFGRVFSTPSTPAPPPAATPLSPPSTITSSSPIKHSGSRTSLVSSVGDDSGLGQGSPIPPPEKIKVVSSSGPIQVTSDGLSAAQLADIQRQMQERLAASGINADVLKGVSGGAESVIRPPKKNQGGPRQGQQGSGKQNGGFKGKQPQLSIFN